ncbi:glycosyl transferase family group 2-domain-containing protein [Mycena sanguinolenta]|nr:glycosyl transferase family group 2-domain-containing protein [Mycena sanguinolenta]
MSTSYSPPSSSGSNARHPPRVPSQLGISHPWTETAFTIGSGSGSPASSAVSFNDVHLEVEEVDRDGHTHTQTHYEEAHFVGREGVTILTSDYDEVDALLHSIYEKTQQDAWFAPSSGGALADASLGGVALRVAAAAAPAALGAPAVAPQEAEAQQQADDDAQAQTQSEFRIFPYNAPHLIPFEAAVRALNPAGAVLVRSAAVTAACARIGPSDNSIYIDSATRIQVLQRMADLPGAEKDQCGAFIRTPPSLVLWAPAVETLAPLAAEFEDKLIKFVWRTRTSVVPSPLPSSSSPTANVNATPARRRDSHAAPGILTSLFGSSVALPMPIAEGEITEVSTTYPDTNTDAASRFREDLLPAHYAATPFDEKFTSTEKQPQQKAKKSFFSWSWRLQPMPTTAAGDPEKTGDTEGGKTAERKLVLLGPLYAGCGAGLAAYFALSGVSVLLGEFALDRDPTRFALLATLPIIFCVSIFFCLQLVGNLSLVLGPVAQYHENSAFYSAVKPAPNPAVDNNLPHITIQCPVYKESLHEVIAPSVLSVKKAMQTYARQGGTSAIFICDDGMQLISEADRKERMAFYANHNIGWTARPGHNKDGFFRKGKFKKASNMNYGLAVSLKLEKHLAALEAAGVTEDDGECLEDKAMHMAVEEMYEESGRRHRPWACNGKSLRVGEIILIIDSDTIVPEDCFRDAAREMYESPDLAIIQHESDVMQVAHHYFENGITHFTRRINKCISYGCANGEVAPFVGHNAFLRWSAVQDAAFDDPDDGKRKQWSESNVSEDFDLALRLLLGGYTLRWATYSEGGFKEGVSLTVVDELARWQKYAYGCDEIIFNPIIRWWRKGPISDQLRGFVWSIAPVHYKIGMMSYMFSYYGIAAATVGSIMNYLLLGLGSELDRFYLHSFEILLACVVVFPGLGNLGFTLLEYRLGHRNFFAALYENLRWVPFFMFFFGGLSIHLSTAILAHLFSYDMTWGSTVKEVERSTFWIEVPRIWQRFKLSFIICFAIIIMMIVMQSNAVPFQYQIPGYQWAFNIPLSLVVGTHILLPIVLNPWLMIFSY